MIHSIIGIYSRYLKLLNICCFFAFFKSFAQ
nr:MAG TPA: hypothetical protein [Caudoviricetes sp.]